MKYCPSSIIHHQEIFILSADSHQGGPGRVLFGEVINVILARLNQIRNSEQNAEFDLIEPHQHRTFTLHEYIDWTTIVKGYSERKKGLKRRWRGHQWEKEIRNPRIWSKDEEVGWDVKICNCTKILNLQTLPAFFNWLVNDTVIRPPMYRRSWPCPFYKWTVQISSVLLSHMFATSHFQ